MNKNIQRILWPISRLQSRLRSKGFYSKDQIKLVLSKNNWQLQIHKWIKKYQLDLELNSKMVIYDEKFPDFDEKDDFDLTVLIQKFRWDLELNSKFVIFDTE